jgi:hypothetical protein
LERKKKQRENLNIVEKKQRLKRIKLQKEKKEKKEKGQDIEEASEEAVPVTNKTEKKEKKEKSVVKKQKAPEAPKTKRTAPATEERQVKKAKKEQSDEFFVKGEKPNKEQQSVVVETPAAPVQVRTGVVGIVDKSKKMKQGSKKNANSDVVAALETEDKQESGTGLDVGGWD